MEAHSQITHGLRVLVVDEDIDEQFLARLALEKVLPKGSTVANRWGTVSDEGVPTRNPLGSYPYR